MEKRSRTEYSLLNSMAGVIGYVLNVLISFLCRMIFVRCLGAEYLGINGLFSNILSVLSLSELGVGTAVGYALYRPVAAGEREKIAAYMCLYAKVYRVIGVVVAVLGVVLLPFLPALVGEIPDIPENIYVLYLLFLFSSASGYFFSYRSTLLTVNQRNYVTLAISYCVVVAQNVLQILALLLWKNYLLYLVIQVAAVLLTHVLISRKTAKDYPYIEDRSVQPLEAEEKRTLVRNVRAVTITKLSGVLVNHTDNIAITCFKGLVTTGVISNYTLLCGMLASLVSQIFTGFSASVGHLNAVESEEHKYRIFRTLTLANFWFYGWGAVGIAVLSGDMVAFFFGQDYVTQSVIPLLLALNFYMAGMQGVVGMYRSTMGLFRHGRYAMLVSAGLNLVGDVILGRLYGVAGILAATALARLASNAWYEPFVVFRHGFRRSVRGYLLSYMGYAVLAASVTALCLLLTGNVALDLGWRLLIKLAVCVAVPNGIFALVFWRSAEFRYLLSAGVRIWRKVSVRFGADRAL